MPRNRFPSKVLTHAASLALCWSMTAWARDIDLKPVWDEVTPLANPHKGWYHHYPDNHVNKYRIARDADLVEFPGMDHLYIRLAWAYLEPAEGKYNWAIIDDLINHWTARGLGISFRISCKETSTDRVEQQFATPKWVMQAGAKGGHYRMGQPTGPEGPWEPVFDDPVFLAKLENFLRAFAARYDGKPWLRYVDVGSIGDWGEGHTWAGSRKPYGIDTLKRHLDLHLKYFTRSQLVVSDDFVFGVGNAEDRRRLHEYVVAKGISYRDDSILVDGYLGGHSRTWTVRSPEYFADVWQTRPTVLELEHYGAVKKKGNWSGEPGSSLARHGGGKKGPDFFRGALESLHATYIGYHGDAAEWLADNPELTGELLNRCGYWLFPHRVSLPDRLRLTGTNEVVMLWENRGVAPAYQPFRLLLRLAGATTVDFDLDARNQAWIPEQPGKVYQERYSLPFSTASNPLKAGTYVLKMKLYSPGAKRDVLLPLATRVRDEQGFYAIAEVAAE